LVNSRNAEEVMGIVYTQANPLFENGFNSNAQLLSHSYITREFIQCIDIQDSTSFKMQYSYSFLSSKFTYDPINKFSGIGYQFSMSRSMKRLISCNLNVSYNHAFVKEEFGKDLKFLNLSFDNVIDFNGHRNGATGACKHIVFGSVGIGNNFRLNNVPNRVANAYNFLLNVGVGYRYKLAKSWDLSFWTKFPFRLTRIHDDRLYDKYWDITLFVSYIPSRSK
jgi:hypothetical protein